MGGKKVYKFEGPAAVTPLHWYLELIEGLEKQFAPVFSANEYVHQSAVSFDDP